jgi:hypothetical protein
MRILRYFAQSANLLNIVLVALMVTAFVYIILPLMKMHTGYSLPQVMSKTAEGTEKPREEIAGVLPADYTVIGEHNLFHPERHIPVDKKVEEASKPEFILYGTMIQDNVQYAFIEDKKNPKTTPGRGARQTTAKKGDTISGFVISEIQTDRVTLTRGDEKMTVLLTNADKRKNGPGTQGPTQTTVPAATRPGQTSPATPFGPVPGAAQQTGTRPTNNAQGTQPQIGVPQQLPRPVGRATAGRTATQTTSESTPMP